MLDGSRFASINFDAEVRPIYDRDGNEIPPQVGRGVYRSDTDEILSVCGAGFKPIQHWDVVAPVLDDLDARGYAIEERKGTQKALYDLAGKKGAFVNVALTSGGAVMRTDIIIGDFIRPTGASSYLDSGPDTLLRRFTGINSHNSSYSVQWTSSYERLICMNGLVTPEFAARGYAKHTTGVSIEGLKAKIRFGLENMEQDADQFGVWARTKLSAERAEEFIKATIAKLAPIGTEVRWSRPKLDEILTLFKREDQTVWGLLQALTYWSTHGEMKRSADPVTGRIGREDEVARTMRTAEFQALLAA